MERYDLIAIGGGTAGLVTAAGAASLGLDVALIERDALGGDCLWTGCVPSKAMIASSRLAHAMRHAEELGLEGAAPCHAFATVMERMNAARDRVAEHDDPERFRRMGVNVLFGDAELIGAGRVRVNGEFLESGRIVIATGAVPMVPPIPGLAEVGYLTYQTAFDQTTLPRRMAVIGGGPIGLELAQVYARLGADVVVIEMLAHVLPREEPEAAGVLEALLREEGIAVRTATRVEAVEVGSAGEKIVHVRDSDDKREALVVNEIFVATGRRPATDSLGLSAAGIETDGPAPVVDRALQTSVPGIWAAGDVAGGPQFTHVADYHAKLVLRNAVFPFNSKVDYTTIPAVTYTDPEVAHVGLTEREARERHGDIAVYRYEFADLDRAIVSGHPEGFVHIVTRRGGKILGATIVGSGGGELLMPIVIAMKQRIPLPKLSRLTYPYPTMSEGVKRAADNYYREKFAGRSGDWLRRIVRWLT